MPIAARMLQGLAYIQHDEFERRKYGQLFVHFIGIVDALRPHLFHQGLAVPLTIFDLDAIYDFFNCSLKFP
jgi:hypothetical protein